MTPHDTLADTPQGSILNQIAYYRCTKTMQHNNTVYTIKVLKTDTIERQVIECLSTLSEPVEWVKVTVEELMRDQKERVRLMEQQAIRVRASLDRLEREMDRLV